MKLVIDAAFGSHGGKPVAALLSLLAGLGNDLPIFGAVEVGHEVDWPAFIQREPCSFVDLAQRLEKADPEDVIIALTPRREEASRLAGQTGIIPVLFNPAGLERETLSSSDPYLVVREWDDVLLLLRDHKALPLFSLFRLNPLSLVQKQAGRWEQVKHRVALAQGLCIYGAGTIGRQALTAAKRAGLPVKAFVDANANLHGQLVSGVPVISAAELLKGIDIVVPALGRHLAQVRQTLQSCGVDTISLSELYYFSQTPSEPEMNYWQDLALHRIRYLALFLALADERSREVLAAVVQHRLSLDPHPLEAVCERGHPQWFDPQFLPQQSSGIFVDGGAFDGDTVEGFIKAHGPDYQAIYAFELDPQIAARGALRLNNHPNVHYRNVGLSNRSGHVSIRSTGGTDGGIAGHSAASMAQLDHPDDPASGETRVEIGRLDDLVPEPITFLKLDVEGEEANVLDGCKHHIQNDHPTIGLAVYHHAHDIWALPELLWNIRSDYNLSLRHYTDLAYETVIYALPAS